MIMRIISVLYIANVLACAPPAAEQAIKAVDHRVEIPAEPENGLQFLQPETIIPAQSEVMTCWVPDWVPSEDLFIAQFTAFQSGAGHHIAAFTSSIPRDAGDVFDCTELEAMTTLEPLLIPDLEDGTPMLPEGFTVRVAAGAKIVFQSHYLNVSDDDILVADVAQLHFQDPSAPMEHAGYFAINHAGLDIPAGETATFSQSCILDRDLQLVRFFGHMHDWGKKVQIHHIAGGEETLVYEVDPWTVEYRDVPPISVYPVESPLSFSMGDVLRITCTFDNTLDVPLRFPEEMCVATGVFFPADEDPFLLCD